MDTCRELGVPLATHKSVGPTTCLTFLGIEIDTLAMELRLPRDKLNRLKDLLAEWQFKRVCSREKLESKMHLSRCIRNGSLEYPEFSTATTASLSQFALTIVSF